MLAHRATQECRQIRDWKSVPLLKGRACECAGKVVAGMDGSLHSREDVARITAALTRASLPMHYRVMLDSERAAQ